MEFQREYAEKLHFGGAKSLDTSIQMRLTDYWYLDEKVRQWQEKGVEPSHEDVLTSLEAPEGSVWPNHT